MPKRKIQTPRRPIVGSSDAAKIDFSWRNYGELARFMSDRAKIYPRVRTGLSAKRQKKLTRAIKHARHLGLLPFSQKIR